MEFITLISSEANEIAEKEQKKTIATEHIDKALKELGFPEYVREVLASAGEMKETMKVSYTRLRPRGATHADVMGDRHGRRRQTKWIKVVFLKKSFCDNSRNCLARRPRNSISLEDNGRRCGVS